MANTPAPPSTTTPPTTTPPTTTPPPATSSANNMGARGEVTPPIEALNTQLIGKYIFDYDYQTTIYTLEARQIIAKAGTAKYTLPEGSFYKLKFSKGDVVDVVSLGRPVSKANSAPLPPSPYLLIINVPKFVKPIGGTKGFSKVMTIDNTNGFLKKTANSTPVSVRYGLTFGRNPNPKAKPSKPNTSASTTKPNTKPNTYTPNTSSTNIFVNDNEGMYEEKGFFESRNNLIMVGVAIVVAYLLFNKKSE